jgi:putative ABC transport system ATP-binding protein
MKIIQAENLSRSYTVGSSSVHALRAVDLEVETGEFVALMGPSGSGKSTMMHLLGCLDTPTTGRYLLEGRDVSTLSMASSSRLSTCCRGSTPLRTLPFRCCTDETAVM